MRGVACVKIHPAPHYRREDFEEGLSRIGYRIANTPLHNPGANDVLVLWNRYSRDEQHARLYEKAGATVLITENAWLGPEDKDRHWFALCKGHHNGAGEWYVGTEPRPFGAQLMPWRKDGEHILVMPQRGMGERGVAMAKTWTRDVISRIERATHRPIRIRNHPGPRPHDEIDFQDCWAVVTWGSGAAIKALAAGIPVFHELKDWIGAPAAKFGIEDLENPFLGDRVPMFHRLSWAMWTNAELRTGEPFRWLLQSGY